MLIKFPFGQLWIDLSHPPAHELYVWKDNGEVLLRFWRINVVVTPNAQIERLSRGVQATGPRDASPDDDHIPIGGDGGPRSDADGGSG